jgi:tRNA G18 (ribose-2'-O)-methylase SpoU
MAVEKIYLTGYTGIPPRKEIAKTALGAEETVPWEQENDPLVIVRKLKEEGWHILALEITPEAVALPSLQAPQNVLLIVGHELQGVSRELLMLCDSVVQIPMLGSKESLNVAVAAGIALYALRNA